MRLLKGFVFLAIVSMSAVALLWALYETPYDGPWVGTGSSGYPVSFTVSGDGTEWNNFYYKLDVYCEHYGVSSTQEFTTPGPGTITDGQFSFSSGGVAFTGAFDTPTTASGTWTLTNYSWVIPLPPPIYVHVHTLNYSGTWTATFNGTLPTIAVTSPNGGENWTAGSTHDITWTTTGSIANVTLELSTNGGADWTAITASTANTGAYSWPVPAPASASCLIRASDASNSGISDTGDAVFAITSSAIPAAERQALIALYNSTNGDSWTNNSGWKTPPLDTDGFAMPGTEGAWFGVTVESGTSAVTQISLQYNGLTGTIPTELGDLTSLQLLNLESNQLSGPLPPELGNLSNLQYLDLDSNPIGGTLPAWFGNLTNMREFSFRYGQLTGAIPPELGNLANLQTLDLGFNQLTDSIPASLGNLSHLQVLNFVFNQFSGPIPPELGNLASLQKIYGDYSGVRGSIPAELGNLTNLLELHLPGNALTGAIPAELGDLTNLQILSLGSNQLSGSIPAELGDLSNLQGLSFSDNQLSGSIPPELGNLANLSSLSLSGNGLSGSIPTELSNLSQLNALNLQSNQLSGSIPAELGGMSNLGVIYLEHNLLSGSIPPELAELDQLGGLYLSYNQLSGPIPPELGTMTSLSVLKIAWNQLSGPIPAELGNLVNVQYLDLTSNQLSGPIPVELGGMTSLRTIDLGLNQLSGPIPPVLGSLPNLFGLHLNSNRLSGSIPIELGGLSNLQYFNIAYNALYASDPDLISFLNTKSPGWAATQTIAPAGVAASPVGGTTIMVSWTPITYQGDTGGYIVSTSPTQGGPYTPAGQTVDKTVSAMNVSGLTPGTPYYFVVRTRTEAHTNNISIVESDDGDEAAAATFAQLTVQGTVLQGGVPLANVVMTGLPGSPVTNELGIYQGIVDAGWNGTVIPILSGYAFVPPAINYAGIVLDQWGQDYEGAPAPTTITLTSPNGGEAWGIGSTHNITWTWTGDMPSVKIEYSTNNGGSWATIVASTSNSGSYAWAVPGPASTTCRVRVSDAAYPGVFDTSNGIFSVVPPIPGSERQALIALYNSTNGDSWTNNTGWKTLPLYSDGFAMPGTEGTWFGVTVIEAVRQLHLDNNNLTGFLPAALGNLTSLTYLDLHSNQLSGSIPPELGNLTGLYRLYLAANQLSGSIPVELGNLSNLYYLSLNLNQLTGSIPSVLGNLTNLQELNLDYNQLTGPIPPELANLTSMYSLYLFNNQLSGSIPPELGTMTNLRYLNLHDNQLTGPIPPELGNMTSLQSLYLWNNRLSGTIPVEIGNLTNLQSLYLRSNQLSGTIPTSLMNLTALIASNSEFGYNALYTSDPDLIAFLDIKAPGWASTQTIAPEGVAASSVGGTTIMVSWNPITYQGDTGGYIVSASPTQGGPYTPAGQTADKTVSAMNVSGLIPGTPYYFVVRTRTEAHTYNTNIVESEEGDEAAAATFAQLTVQGTILEGGIPLANVVMTGLPGDPVTNASGVYQATADVGWNGTVTPILSGYAFVPPAISYAGIVLDQWGQDYEGAPAPTTITLTSPNGGEGWGIGSSHNITWTWTGDMPSVKIEYSTNGGTNWATVVASTSNSGSYAWAVPGPASTSCLIRVSDAAYPGVLDSSDTVFSVVPPIPGTQRQALIALYSSTNGDSWTNNSGWKTPPLDSDGFAMPGTEGTWFGVGIDGTPSVISLTLYSNQLSGSIPAELGDLTSLQLLNLESNQLSGPLPPELGNLSNLQYLDLDSNPIGGTLPAWFGNLTNMREFSFRYGQLTGAIPPELGNLANLQTLDLGFNQLTDSIPASLGNLSHLQVLNFVFNQFSGPVPPELGNLASLQKIYGDYSGVSGSIPAELGNLTNLLELHLPGNALTGAIPAELGDLTNLQILSLGSNQLSGSIPAELGDLSNLRLLSLDYNLLTGPIPPELGNLTNLQHLQLISNQLSGSIPPELGNLSQLIILDLRSNQLSGSILPELGDMTNLGAIYLEHNLLSGSIPPELAELDQLGGLYLSYNQLSGPIPPELGTMTSLSVLKIAWNQLSGPIPAELGNLVNVQYLDLTSNQLSGPIPVELGGMTSLRTIDLGLNQLSGPIPPVLGSLPNLFGLHLNSNRLSGSIPIELGGLSNLQYFNIAYNALYASDPDLISFLNTKSPGWAATQTIAPAGVAASPVGGTTIMVSWTPITYQGDTGGYIVSTSPTQGGPYTPAGQTVDKTVSAMNVSGLTPGTPYYFVVRTRTDAHVNNQNVLESEDSGEATAATFAQLTVQGTILQGGVPLANVVMTGLSGDPVTDPSGVYQGAVVVGWSGTVTPMLAGYTFDPANRTYTTITADQMAQGYAATAIVPTITVTSPNGGESWIVGTTHAITWTQTGMTGSVTVDLYKGGVYQKILGTAESTAGTFTWVIDAGETAGTDYRALVWQGSVSDESDADFAITTAAVRKDDLVGTWDSQGVYYRNSDTGEWVAMASPATMITTGDIDADGTDDLIGIWPSQGGVWIKYYATGEWVNLSSSAVFITTGDMNGDGRNDLLGTWDGQGVYYRDSATGAWVLMATPASMITCGDLDNDGTDDLIGIWAGQGGVWVKYSSSGLWEFIGSTPSYIGAGDMNGDGRDELLGSWAGQGVYYRNSETGDWTQLSSEATMITSGDLEGDGTDDLLGLWPTQGGIWVKYSSTGGWELLSSTAQYITAGKMRPVSELGAPAAGMRLPLPMGGTEPGPESALRKKDESSKGPGGLRFAYMTEPNLVPNEKGSAKLTRVPGPGEHGFTCAEQENLSPQERVKRQKEGNRK